MLQNNNPVAQDAEAQLITERWSDCDAMMTPWKD